MVSGEVRYSVARQPRESHYEQIEPDSLSASWKIQGNSTLLLPQASCSWQGKTSAKHGHLEDPPKTGPFSSL